MHLVNARTRETLATDVELADTRATRRRGLLGRDSLARSAALVLSPCWAIHTTFMRFAIDVIFVDRNGRAVRIVRDLGPWRLAAALRAYATIEFQAGSLQARDIKVGDELYLTAPTETRA